MKKILSILIILCSFQANAQLLGSIDPWAVDLYSAKPSSGIRLHNGNILFTAAGHDTSEVFNVYAGGGFYAPQTNQLPNAIPLILKHLDDDKYLEVSFHRQVALAHYDTIAIRKFLPDGTGDSTFGNNGIRMIPIYTYETAFYILHPYDLTVMKDSSLILTYAEEDSIIYNLHVKALKLKSDGTSDSTFGQNGHVILPLDYYEKPHSTGIDDLTYANIPALEDNDHHLYFGGSKNLNKCLIRYNETGIFDTAYGYKTGVDIGGISKLILDYSGDILALGMTYDNALSALGWFVKKYKPNGDLNTGFGVNGEVAISAFYLNNGFLQPDGKIILFGQSTSHGNLYGRRLNVNGSIDNSWLINSTYQQCGNYSQENFVYTSSMEMPGELVYVVGFFNFCSQSGLHVLKTSYNPCGNGNTISSLPVLTASDLNLCQGVLANDTIFFTGNLNGASYWEYYTNLNPLPVQIYGNAFEISPNVSTTYYVRGAGYCSGIGPADSITVNVFPNTTSYTNATICVNQIPYTWNGLTIDSQGVYTATLTNANGCDSVATLNLNISVCGLCQNGFTANWSPFVDSLVESQTWINTSGTVLIPVGAKVKFDANIGGYVTLNPGFKADSGSVFVAQAYNGCTAGAPQLPNAKLFIGDPFVNNEIVLYPNPTSGMIHIQHDEKLTGIQIFDMVGKLIINQKCTGEKETNIDLSNLPNGVYLVKAAGYQSIKVVKAN